MVEIRRRRVGDGVLACRLDCVLVLISNHHRGGRLFSVVLRIIIFHCSKIYVGLGRITFASLMEFPLGNDRVQSLLPVFGFDPFNKDFKDLVDGQDLASWKGSQITPNGKPCGSNAGFLCFIETKILWPT